MLAYWDASRRCRFANRAHEAWFGVSPEELIDVEIGEVRAPIYAVSGSHVEAALRGEIRQFERDVPDPRGGPPRRAQTNFIPHIVDGSVRGFCVFVQDVTRRAQLATELGGPLAAVVANVELARTTLDAAKVDPALWRPMLDELDAATQRMTALVRDAAEPRAEPIRAFARASTPPVLHRLRVTVIDDDQLLGRGLARALAGDYDVRVFDDARAAIAALTAAEPGADLILSDVMMPGVTGIDVLRQITEAHPQLARRFVFMTGGTPDALWDELSRQLAIPVLEKPFETPALRAALAGRVRII